MPLNLSLNPTTTGEVFISTYDAIEQKTLPTTLLPSSHPFREFWTGHLAALRQPGLYDTVIDALVAITRRDASWRSRRNTDSNAIVHMRSEMRDLFRRCRPDIVVVSGMAQDGYGFHLREPLLWPFIHISEDYINLWKDADRSTEQGLGLAVLIAAVVDHELGHWIFTLTTGFFSPMMAADNLSDVLSQLEQIDNKHTPKTLGVKWKADSGEAGEFVETRSRGGIVGYSKDVHKAFIVTGEKDEDVHILPLLYLQSCLEGSSEMRPSLRFIPPGPGSSTKMKNSFFPRIADNCAQPSGSSSGSVGMSHCESQMRAGMHIRELIQQLRLQVAT